MRSIVIKPRRSAPAILSILAGLFLVMDAQAGALPGKNGSVLLRMCKSADTVKMLSVMCHSYLDGYIDAAHHHDKGKAAFCLGDNDRKTAPDKLVAWIEAHPESLTQPASEVLQQALARHFPCKRQK
jgi:hypothetical protein